MVVGKILIRVFSLFLGLIFLALTVFGIIAVVRIPAYVIIGAGVIIFGIVGLIVCFAGCCGAGYEKDFAEKDKMKVWVSLLILIVFRQEDIF